MKIKYEVLALALDYMYPPHYTLKHGETLEQHLMDIDALIEQSGWTNEEFISEYVHRGLKDHFGPEPKEMN